MKFTIIFCLTIFSLVLRSSSQTYVGFRIAPLALLEPKSKASIALEVGHKRFAQEIEYAHILDYISWVNPTRDSFSISGNRIRAHSKYLFKTLQKSDNVRLSFYTGLLLGYGTTKYNVDSWVRNNGFRSFYKFNYTMYKSELAITSGLIFFAYFFSIDAYSGIGIYNMHIPNLLSLPIDYNIQENRKQDGIYPHFLLGIKVGFAYNYK